MTKIKIDEQGFLSIEKRGKMVKQCCPYCSDTNESRCGTWCPHFYLNDAVLSLCGKTHYMNVEVV